MDRYSQLYPATQLMTIEEAKRLSTYGEAATREELQRERQRVWSWQSVEGVMSQTVSDEQVERLARRARR